jgi:hypothetical protein
MGLVAVTLVFHFYKQLKTVFATKTIFGTAADFVGNMWDTLQSSDSFTPPSDVDTTTKEGQKKFSESLFSSYFFTAILWKISRRLKDISDSRRVDICLIFSWLITVALTIFSFALLYSGLEAIEPGSFTNVESFWGYLGYSMCVITTSGLSGIEPITQFAMILSYIELFGTALVLILMVFLILTSLRDRYRKDLDRVATELGATSTKFERLLIENYDLTIQAAEEWLMRSNATTARWVLGLRHDKRTIEALEARVIEEKDNNAEQSG